MLNIKEFTFEGFSQDSLHYGQQAHQFRHFTSKPVLISHSSSIANTQPVLFPDKVLLVRSVSEL